MFSIGNKKLHTNVAAFSLPSGKKWTCPEDCPKCYSMRLEKLRPSVLMHRRKNLAISKTWDFPLIAVDQLKRHMQKHLIKYVRVHEGGEYYDQEYIMKWQEIASKLPQLMFYSYTKAEHLDFEPLKELDNFAIFRSLEPRQGKVNYVPIKEWLEYKNRGFVVCRSHSEPQCGKTCDYCMRPENCNACPIFLRH